MWDIGGQEALRETWATYYGGAKGLVRRSPSCGQTPQPGTTKSPTTAPASPNARATSVQQKLFETRTGCTGARLRVNVPPRLFGDCKPKGASPTLVRRSSGYNTSSPAWARDIKNIHSIHSRVNAAVSHANSAFTLPSRQSSRGLHKNIAAKRRHSTSLGYESPWDADIMALPADETSQEFKLRPNKRRRRMRRSGPVQSKQQCDVQGTSALDALFEAVTKTSHGETASGESKAQVKPKEKTAKKRSRAPLAKAQPMKAMWPMPEPQSPDSIVAALSSVLQDPATSNVRMCCLALVHHLPVVRRRFANLFCLFWQHLFPILQEKGWGYTPATQARPWEEFTAPTTKKRKAGVEKLYSVFEVCCFLKKHGLAVQMSIFEAQKTQIIIDTLLEQRCYLSVVASQLVKAQQLGKR